MERPLGARPALPAGRLVWRTGNIKRVRERLHILW